MDISVVNKQILGLIATFLVVRFFVFPTFIDIRNDDFIEHEDTLAEEQNNSFENPFSKLKLQAAAAYVVDLRTGKELFSQNENAELPLASLTKIMTALIASESIDESEPITISPESLNQEGDSGLFPFEQFRAKDLIDLTLVASSNDGAKALASAIGGVSDVTSIMNQKAHDLGLEKTYFENETGLDVNEEFIGGAYGSAKDVAKMLNYVVSNKPELLEATRNQELSVSSLNGFLHNFKNTNEASDEIPWLIGSKTGYTDLAGGNLAVVFDAGLAHPIAAVVLGSTKEDRFKDIKKIVDTTFEYFSNQ